MAIDWSTYTAPKATNRPMVTADSWGNRTYPEGPIGDAMRKADANAALTFEEQKLLERAFAPPPTSPYTMTRGPQGRKMWIPNPEWGRENGQVLDETTGRWRPRTSADDIRAQLAAMEMEKRRYEEQRAREEHQRQRRWADEDRARQKAAEDFKRQQEAWAYQELQRRAGGVAPDEQRPWKNAPGQPGGIEYTDTQAYRDSQMEERKRKIAMDQDNFAKQHAQNQSARQKALGISGGALPPSAAQPVEPPSEGTPYSPQTVPASAYGFKPPPGGSSNFAVMEWWHQPATGRETQATRGSVAPPGWVKGRASASPESPPAGDAAVPAYQPGPDGGQWMSGLRAWNDPSNPNGPGAKPPKPILIAPPRRPAPPMVY